MLGIALMLAACADENGLGEAPIPDFHGVWRGMLRESTSGNFGEGVASMSQRDAQISGTWQATYYTVENGGTISGIVATDGDSATFTLVSSIPGVCALSVTLVLRGNEATGNYASVPCPTNPNPNIGTVRIWRDSRDGTSRYAPAPPPAPGRVTVTAGDGENVLTWSLVDNATGYTVYWSTAPDVTPTDHDGRFARAAPPFYDTGLVNGVSLYYIVTASNLGGESAPSAEVGATPLPPVPGAPEGVSITAGDGRVTLSWQAVTGAESYNVYWATAPGVTKTTGTRLAGVTSPYTHSGLSNGKAYYYVATALNADGESAESVEVSATPEASAAGPMGGWQEVAPMPTARRAPSANAVNGRIYVAGGINGVSLNVVEEYTPDLDSWRSRARMGQDRYMHGSAVVDGRVYVFGGSSGNGSTYGLTLNSTEEYDPATDTWQSRAPMPTARWSVMGAAVNGRIYAIGGKSGSVMRAVEIYDPASDTWSTGAPMPTARCCGAAVTFDGQIYVIGGGDGYLTAVERYDPVTDTWAIEPGMPTGRSSHTAQAAGGRLYAMGGWNGAVLEINEAFDPSTSTWHGAAPLPTRRNGLASAVISSRIYTFGGWDGTTVSAAAEVYAASPSVGAGAVDQEQPLIDAESGLMYAIGGSSEQKLAQVVTAGVTGSLVDVRFPVGCAGELVIEIQRAADGLPNGEVLGTTVLSAAQVGPHDSPPGFKPLPLAVPVPLATGEQFAVVLDSPGSCGMYLGPVGDPYPGGSAFFDSRPNPPGVWIALSEGRNDLAFQTVMATGLSQPSGQ
jgi:N-acetylneuraminic acid mutarotase